MPLDPAALKSSLETLFSEPPLLVGECADAWGDAMLGYATGVVPASATVTAAATTLAAALAAAFATPVAAPMIDAAFMAFATTVAGGMAPAFLGVVPPAPLGIGDLFVAPTPPAPQPTHASAAAVFAAKIDLWFRTGSASLVLTPFTAVPAWS